MTQSAPSDLIAIIKRIGREFAAGLNIDDDTALAKLAKHIESDLTPRINPDRRYRISELDRYGYKPGRFYKAHKHLIHKDGGISYVLGRDLLTLAATAPTLAVPPASGGIAATLPRRRGRPRKQLVDSSPAELDERYGVSPVNLVARR